MLVLFLLLDVQALSLLQLLLLPYFIIMLKIKLAIIAWLKSNNIIYIAIAIYSYSYI